MSSESGLERNFRLACHSDTITDVTHSSVARFR
jgi:hypothetical protein